ncbi:MAG: hypothetical protein V1793_25850 [Pseudomonadota bacterium]
MEHTCLLTYDIRTNPDLMSPDGHTLGHPSLKPEAEGKNNT